MSARRQRAADGVIVVPDGREADLRPDAFGQIVHVDQSPFCKNQKRTEKRTENCCAIIRIFMKTVNSALSITN
jgi:hypothetical protein